MTYTTHSPAPWGLDKSGDWLQLEGGAKPMVGDRYMSICVTATSEPDKRLIIAAPELLEALKDMIAEFSADEFGAEAQMNACWKAKQAVAKAEDKS